MSGAVVSRAYTMCGYNQGAAVEVHGQARMTFPRPDWCGGDPSNPDDQWPPAEVTDGVAGFSISSYGDEPGGAYVQAWGPDALAVQACVERVAKLVACGGLLPLWGAR